MAETGRTWMPVVRAGTADELVGMVQLEGLLQGRIRHLDEERRRERPLDLRPAWLVRAKKDDAA